MILASGNGTSSCRRTRLGHRGGCEHRRGRTATALSVLENAGMSDNFEWHIDTPVPKEGGLQYSWVDDYRLRVRRVRDEIVIEGDAAGLETLAQHLLTLAQPAVASGSHLHLEESNGLDSGSASVVLERQDDPADFE